MILLLLLLLLSAEARDCYDILGIPIGASNMEIKRAFHKMARKYYPDRNKATDAAGKFSEIVEGISNDFQKFFSLTVLLFQLTTP